MRRVWTTAVYLALIILALTLMSLAGQPVETPAPTPSATQTPTLVPTPTPSPTPGTVSIPMPDGFDGDLDRLWVGIPVEGLE